MDTFKTANSWMKQLGIDSYFNVITPLEAIHEGAEATSGLLDGTWEGDPNAFQRAGMGYGMAAGSAMMTAPTWYTSYRMARLHGGEEALKWKGNTYKMKDLKANFDEDTIKHMRKTGTKGVLKDITDRNGTRSSVWRKGLGKGNLAMWGVTIAASILAPMALGFAGKFMDAAASDARARKQIGYDSRYFNTQQYDASSYQQLGMAMDNYSKVNVSLGRILHSRG